jgi:hypothetical protein
MDIERSSNESPCDNSGVIFRKAVPQSTHHIESTTQAENSIT